MTLRIGLLGMPDNFSTRVLLEELDLLGRRPDVVFLLKPDWRTQKKRLIKKIRMDGVVAALSRIAFALRAVPAAGEKESFFWPEVIHETNDFNGEHCRKLIAKCHLDILLLATDTLIGRGTFALPRLGTINAHPGWMPRYRGLGSVRRMINDGLQPAISVHLVDEGIDTGPVLLRRSIDIFPETSWSFQEELHRYQARMFVEVIKLYESGLAMPIDTFLEPSNMSRGVCPERHSLLSLRSLEKAESRFVRG